MERALRWYDYLTINVFFLGLTTVAQTNGLVFPLLVQQFVGETGKASFFGTLRLWTLMVALLVQAVMGMLSDRSRLPLGRRRPFILVGTLLTLVLIIASGLSAGMQGMVGFWFLFVVVILMQFSSNIAQSAQQGLIPDLIPEEKRGRFSGIKALLEVPLPLLIVSFTIARLVSSGNLWAGLGAAMAVLAVSMLLTMLVPEKRLTEIPPELNWKPFLRLVGMTILFTTIILAGRQIIVLFGDMISGVSSPVILFIWMGLIGLVVMLVAVGLGVYTSVRISLGNEAKDNPSFSWWVVNRLAYLVGAVNLSTFAVYYFQGRLGYDREQAAQPASYLILIVGVFILLSTLPSGWLADRFGHRRLVAFSGLLASLGTVIAILIPNLIVIYIGGCLIGIATGIFFTANWALGTSLVPKGQAARYLGISNLAGAGAGAVGAYIGGPIADYFTVNLPQYPGLGYVLLFTIYGAIFFFSVIALRQVHFQLPTASAISQPAGLG